MTTAGEERVLPGGLLRTCRPGDLEQVGALLAARGDPTDAEDQRPAVQDPGTWFEVTAVVVDGDRLLGPHGMYALSRRRADVHPALYPPLTADLLTCYLPY
jgi:hypothetical protein